MNNVKILVKILVRGLSKNPGQKLGKNLGTILEFSCIFFQDVLITFLVSVSASMLLVACSVFHAKTDEDSGQTGLQQDWTMYLGWVTAVFSLFTTIAICAHAVLNRKYYQI